MIKFWKITLLTLLLVVFFGKGEIFWEHNVSNFFPSNHVFAQTTTERKVEGDRLLQQGIEQLANIDSGQADSTLALFQKALTIYREIQDRGGEGQVLKNLGIFYYQLEDYSQALDYTQKTLKIAQEIPNFDLEARAFNNQGLIYYTQKNYLLAIDSYQNGLSVIQKITSQELKLLLNYNLANAYKDSKYFSKAINHYEKALSTAQKVNNLQAQYGILNNLAEVHGNLGNNGQANNFYQQAFEIAKQIDANEINSLPKEEIEDITVPSRFSIYLQGEIDGESFNNLPGTLEIRPPLDGDSNPFLVSLYMNEMNPENFKFGSLFWQSYTPDHPQEQKHYSQITVTDGQVRMKINPSQGLRSDVMWSTQSSLGDELEQLQQELDQMNEEINQINEEMGKPRIELYSSEMPNKSTYSAVVPQSGILIFSIQENQITGKINASGFSGEGQASTYQAEFTGQIIQQQSENNQTQKLLNTDDFEKNQISNQNNNNLLQIYFLDKDIKKKTLTANIKSNLPEEKPKQLLSLSGIKEAKFNNFQGAWWGEERLQKTFLKANWIFFEDNIFVFDPPSSADLRDDLFPIFGNYSKIDNIWKIRGELNSSGSTASIDGTIIVEGEQAILDAIYVVSGSDSQRIVRVSQTLFQKNIKTTYNLPITEIERIKVPSTFKISLQGETDGKSFGTLSGTLKIKPNPSKNSNLFLVILETDARDRHGSLSWLAEESLSSSSFNSEITVNNNQVVLKLKPTSTLFPDLNWWTLPSGNINESNNSPQIVSGVEGELVFTIQDNQISGKIEAIGNSSAWQTSTYQANLIGELGTLPPSFQGVWNEKSLAAFEEVTLRQEGEKVYGTYTGMGGGTIEGIVQETRLDFTWKSSDEKEGQGFFRAVSGGRTLTGIWETAISSIEKKSFLAERTKESSPNPIATELAEDKWYLKDLGTDLVLQGRCEQALTPLEEALRLYKQERNNTESHISTTYGYLIDEVNIIRNLTHCHFQLQDYENLITSLENAIEVRQAMNQTKYLPLSSSKQANLVRSVLGNYVENWRQRLTEDADKIAALDNAKPFFQTLITYLVELDAKEEALLASELARARAFADLLENQVSFSKSNQYTIANSPSIEQIQKIAEEQNATLVEYWIVEDDSIAQNNQQNQESKIYIWVIQPDGKIDFRAVNLEFVGNPLDRIVNEARQHLLGAGKETRLRPIVADAKNRGNTADQTFKPGDLVRLKTDPPEYLREVVDVYPKRNSVAVRFANQGFDAPIREVVVSEIERVLSPITEKLKLSYQLLIDPIVKLLPTNPEAHVIFIPHQELFLLPFPALQDKQGQYLIDNYTILTSPAIQVLESTHKRRQQVPGDAQEILVVGNPSPMPKNLASIRGTKKEAEVVAQRLQTQAFIGEEATEKNIRQKLAQAKLIHLATHGRFNPENPLQGAIALAPSDNEYDGLLTAEKILNLDDLLNAELVVLSACDTGRGKISGDGVIGLSRSWMVAGVPSIIISLWQVPDEKATPLLMEKFYEEYTKKNLDKAQALRRAMLTTKDRYPDPKNWAAFTLIGEAE